MTAPPLPATPCMRVRLDYSDGAQLRAGSRFYLSYAGSSPTPGNCITLAGDIASAWSSHLAPLINSTFFLTEVDVLDIASVTGASGQATPDDQGGMTGTPMATQCSTNVEFGIARRYRGGKPRMFLPPPDNSAQGTPTTWSGAFVTSVGTGVTAFFTAVEALSVGAVGALAHVNVSYYSGFKNITNSSGRERAVPTYRDTASVDTVESYIVKQLIGSQKRRRAATTY